MVEKGVVIVDLDGTLVKCNTFTEYVRHIAWRHPVVMWYVLKRKLRLISHAEVKRKIMGVKITDGELHGFVDKIMRYLRPDVMAIIKGKNVILASAAPEFYVSEIASRAGIGLCIGTAIGSEENKGEVKLKNVLKMLDGNGGVIDTVITDHHDDLPLLMWKSKHENIIVAPSPHTMQVLRKSGVEVSRLLR